MLVYKYLTQKTQNSEALNFARDTLLPLSEGD